MENPRIKQLSYEIAVLRLNTLPQMQIVYSYKEDMIGNFRKRIMSAKTVEEMIHARNEMIAWEVAYDETMRSVYDLVMNTKDKLAMLETELNTLLAG